MARSPAMRRISLSPVLVVLGAVALGAVSLLVRRQLAQREEDASVELLAALAKQYRTQIEYVESHTFSRPPTISRAQELELFAAPEIVEVLIQTQASDPAPGPLPFMSRRFTSTTAIKSASFQTYEENMRGSIESGSGKLSSGATVRFINYRGTTREENLPFKIRFDLDRVGKPITP